MFPLIKGDDSLEDLLDEMLDREKIKKPKEMKTDRTEPNVLSG